MQEKNSVVTGLMVLHVDSLICHVLNLFKNSEHLVQVKCWQ